MTSQLRHLTLHQQGLSKPLFGNGLAGTLAAIKHLAYVQIDTLSVVERAHHHVLWSRVPDYDLNHLNLLVKEQQIFEYWYHAASYLPMRDYRFALPNMKSVREGKQHHFKDADPQLMKHILNRVATEGPLRMRDFKDPQRSKNKSWNWGPVRRAFDRLFMQGDLMVCQRNGMEKIYDLAEHCLPADINLTMPTTNEYANYLFDNTLRAHGVFTWKQLLHLKTGPAIRDAMQQVVEQRLQAGEIVQLNNDDLPVTFVSCKLAEPATTPKNTVKILSPFDNAVIHRDRLSALFNFDYRIECYLPKNKRVYGYFCLPVLFGDRFVGRIDCKAHRADKKFEVLSLHLETDALDEEVLLLELNIALRKFADFNQCHELKSCPVIHA